MTDQTVEQLPDLVRDYLERVNALYSEVRQWCSQRELEVSEGTIELNEEQTPLYAAPSLRITRGGARLAEVVPIGAAIIGAHGRVA